MAINKGLLNLIDRTEGGGSYSTLYGHRQKRKGPFEGVDVSQMTIGQVMDFTRPDGAYGQSVKSEIGRVATPTGRYQIVGTTLRNAANELGLDPSTPYDAATQDLIANHLAQKRISSASTPEGKRAALRAEWEGFKHVSDADLDAAIAGQGTYVDPMVAKAPAGTTPTTVATATPRTGIAGELDKVGAGMRDGMDKALGVEVVDGKRNLWGFDLADLSDGMDGFVSTFAANQNQAPPPPPQGGLTRGVTPIEVSFETTSPLIAERKKRGGLGGFGGFRRMA